MKSILDKKTPLNVPILLVLIIPLLCLLPFVTKAFHVDDALFVRVAKQIHANPADSYGFTYNWNGFEEPVSQINKNPPLISYYIAFVTWIFGWHETPLHLAFLIPALAMSLGTYCLAKRLCLNPHWAALAAVLTPAFLVSATNVMSDVLMSAFYVWGAALWLLGLERNRPLYLTSSAVCIALSTLTKYFGITLVPLLAVFTLTKKRELGPWILYLIIPVLVLGAYEWATHLRYGEGLLSSAAAFAVEDRYQGHANLFMKILTLLAFTGGCLLSSLFFSPFLWSSRSWAMATWILATLTFFLVFMAELSGDLRDSDGVRWGFVTQYIFFIIAGAHILVLAIVDLWTHRDAPSLLLFLWILGTFFFAGFVNWTINARVVLPMAPAMGILIMRRIDYRAKARGVNWQRKIVWPMIPAACIALSVTWADFRLANAQRSVAETIRTQDRESPFPYTLWFQGHWGFQYYMESIGAKALDIDNSWLRQGDVVVVPIHNTNVAPPRWEKFRQRPKSLERRACGWMGTMNSKLGAGFYSAQWGCLPFAFGAVPPEEYLFFQIGTSEKNGQYRNPASYWFEEREKSEEAPEKFGK